MSKIDGNTRLFGILGDPVSHSFSPLLHNSAFAYCKINARYLPFHVKNIKDITSSLEQLGVHGVSITIPHKVNILHETTLYSEDVKRIGAANTMIWDKERQSFCLYNTDVSGALRAIIASGVDLKRKKVLLLGTGGSAKAIGAALINELIQKIAIVGRNFTKVNELKQMFKILNPSIEYEEYMFEDLSKDKKSTYSVLTPDISKTFDIIIQTTPIGMSTFSKDSVLKEDYFRKDQVVFDIIYNPHETTFLQIAKKKGCQIICGIDMLLYQACDQFLLFTGTQAPEEYMRSTLKEILI